LHGARQEQQLAGISVIFSAQPANPWVETSFENPTSGEEKGHDT
jgi:hypothetical protein